MHGSQRCCGELMELKVDDIWHISHGAVDKTSSSFSAHGKIGNFIIIIMLAASNFRYWHIVVGEILRSIGAHYVLCRCLNKHHLECAALLISLLVVFENCTFLCMGINFSPIHFLPVVSC